MFLILIDAFIKSKNILVSLMTVYASFLLMVGYGSGFAREWIKKIVAG
jgi:hypothetical protein